MFLKALEGSLLRRRGISSSSTPTARSQKISKSSLDSSLPISFLSSPCGFILSHLLYIKCQLVPKCNPVFDKHLKLQSENKFASFHWIIGKLSFVYGLHDSFTEELPHVLVKAKWYLKEITVLKSTQFHHILFLQLYNL